MTFKEKNLEKKEKNIFSMKKLIILCIVFTCGCSIFRNFESDSNLLSGSFNTFNSDPQVSMVVTLDYVEKVNAYIRINTLINTTNDYFLLSYNHSDILLTNIKTFVEYKDNIKYIQHYALIDKDLLRKIRTLSNGSVTNLTVSKDNLFISDLVGGKNIMQTTEFIFKNILLE